MKNFLQLKLSNKPFRNLYIFTNIILLISVYYITFPKFIILPLIIINGFMNMITSNVLPFFVPLFAVIIGFNLFFFFAFASF